MKKSNGQGEKVKQRNWLFKNINNKNYQELDEVKKGALLWIKLHIHVLKCLRKD